MSLKTFLCATDRERQIDRQADRQTDRQAGRQAGRKTEAEAERKRFDDGDDDDYKLAERGRLHM